MKGEATVQVQNSLAMNCQLTENVTEVLIGMEWLVRIQSEERRPNFASTGPKNKEKTACLNV